MNARRFIKKQIVDSTMNTASKVGTFAEDVSEGINPTARIALTTIKKASSKAMNDVNEAMRKIESFERWQSAKQVASQGVRAAAFGGVAGGIGGTILRRMQGEKSS